ncbi:SAVED domain-containing protein [Pseudomonas sichuanensis]|uniref:SAVED domain-containing protein n=2 Tax=Pseudomonas sichuanensis TaxID=2213015 RepID=UPI00216068D3|nr:SAVED domain-containing protein [Pseudomonas sichuanensis]UVK84845.1 SAVED domain-containing protein [Pseudomonas sichuanensis]
MITAWAHALHTEDYREGIIWMLLKELLSWGRKLLEWYIRPKSFGVFLVSYGALLVLATLAGGLVVGINYTSDATHLQASVDTSGGTPGWMAGAGFVVGVLMILTGVCINVYERKQFTRRRVLLLEHKGLHGIDSPLDAVVRQTVGGNVETILVDIRENIHEGRITQPEVALQKVVDGRGDLLRRLGGQNRNDIEIVYGGLMPVPFTFVTGCLVDDEGGGLKIFDWDRLALGGGEWRQILSARDDGDRLDPVLAPSENTDHMVLALSVSYPVDEVGIASTFPGIPLTHMRMNELSSNAHWSLEKQSALAEQFLQMLKKLSAQQVKTIHLVIAAPNSVVFNLGRIYDRRLLPAAIIYQYERSNNPTYPWGVSIPSHAQQLPAIVHRVGN